MSNNMSSSLPTSGIRPASTGAPTEVDAEAEERRQQLYAEVDAQLESLIGGLGRSSEPGRPSIARDVAQLDIRGIAGHYYKHGVIRFRCTTGRFSSLVVLSLQEIIRAEPMKFVEYLQRLTPKGMSTLIKRNPNYMELLREELVRRRVDADTRDRARNSI